MNNRGLWRLLLVICVAAACLLSRTVTAYAFPVTQCAGDRFGSNLGCQANDVSITSIQIVVGSASCIGGTNITVDLNATVNFGNPTRYDIGVFISNDGKDPQLTVANGGAASCSVAILPLIPPFENIDLDGCGDGHKAGVGGGTGSGILLMPGVTISCQAISGSSGNLYIPFVVSWNQSSGLDCYSIADPVPGGKPKCNAPTVLQGTVSVVVLPTITNTDNISNIGPGDSNIYTIVITNTTGVILDNAVFKDPAVANLTANSVTCSAAGGATCPASVTVAAMQGAGITIPSMPVGGSVTFTIGATLSGSASGTLTDTANVTVGGQTNSASDSDNIVAKKARILNWREVVQ